jgi:hypothetical protein
MRNDGPTTLSGGAGRPVRKRLAPLLVLIVCALAPASSAFAAERLFTAQELRSDLKVIEHVVHEDHPDISHSADVAALSARLRQIGLALDHPMTRDAAWSLFATLNPIMADGHMVVTFPNWRGMASEHLDRNGAFFPFEVIVADDGRMLIKAKLGGVATPLTGARILSINGVGADKVSAELLARVHGDTPQFRAGLLSDRFWFYYWKIYGDAAAYDLQLVQGRERRRLRVEASNTKPAVLAHAADFDSAFAFKLSPCHAAVLTLRTFDWPDKDRFFAFTQQAFSEIRRSGVKTLIIDVRDNGGGDDDMWMKGVLRYVATKPYRWSSQYRKRVIKGHPEPGHEIGDVVSGALDSLVQPDLDNPLHFDGRIYLLIGRHSYSSSVLFANVVQDFGFGTVVGSGRLVRADTSGGDQDTVLPNTGLDVGWPRFILYRPLPSTTPAMLTPAIKLQDDPLHPDLAIGELLRSAVCR